MCKKFLSNEYMILLTSYEISNENKRIRNPKPSKVNTDTEHYVMILNKSYSFFTDKQTHGDRQQEIPYVDDYLAGDRNATD